MTELTMTELRWIISELSHGANDRRVQVSSWGNSPLKAIAQLGVDNLQSVAEKLQQALDEGDKTIKIK